MKEKIVLIGGGGHCHSVIDVIEQENKYEILGIIDKKELIGKKILNYEVIASDDELNEIFKICKYAVITIGQIETDKLRKKVFKNLKDIGFNLPIIISPLAYVSKYSQIEEGTVVFHHALINANSKIGVNCIINTKALIEHDAIIEDFCHISTGAIVNGGVQIKEGNFYGSNATSKQYIIIDKFIKSWEFSEMIEKHKVFIIAEAGVNHNGSIELAKNLIDVAVNAGVDAVKFQTFKAKNLVSKNAQKADYQKETTDNEESQFEMIKKLELDIETHKELITYCNSKNIMFLSTPFDHDSIDLLNNLDLKIFKIPSGEITNLPYLRHIGSLKKEVILSTGMADIGEIEDALDILIDSGTKKENITILHANTMYPTPMKDVNLKAMNTIGNTFDCKYGYSDHTLGIEVDIAAVAMGATCIEKHFTLDKMMEGPDHKASLEPNELISMVKAIRNIELALGSSIKKPSSSERPNMKIARKSIVANCKIRKGEILTEDKIAIKRPGSGISPMLWDNVLNSIAQKDYLKDELI